MVYGQTPCITPGEFGPKSNEALTGTLSVGMIIALLLCLQEWTLVLVLLHLREAMFLGYVGAAVQFSHSNLTKRQVTI